MAFITLEDLTGSIEIIAFPSVYERFTDELKQDSKILIRGRVDLKEEETPKVIAEEIEPLEKRKEGVLVISLSEYNGKVDEKIESLKEFFLLHPGNIPVTIYSVNSLKAILVDKSYYVNFSEEFSKKICSIIGPQNCLFIEKAI
jgi:DNA polymerase-3 subunit alpha